MMGVSRCHNKEELGNICNRIKMKERIYQNLLHAAEYAQCNAYDMES